MLKPNPTLFVDYVGFRCAVNSPFYAKDIQRVVTDPDVRIPVFLQPMDCTFSFVFPRNPVDRYRSLIMNLHPNRMLSKTRYAP